jgi:hypothetical protein
MNRVEGAYHRRQNALEDSTEDIEDIAGKPDDDELQGQSIGRAPSEILNNLGRKYNDPARN